MALQSAPALAAPGTQAPQNAAAGAASAQPSPSALGFRIRNADEESDRPAAAPALASTPLGPTEKKQLLARLPALTQTADDSKDFALRAPSIPVPRTGPTLNASFPPPPASIPTPMGVSAQGPLKVERYAPEGPVEIAPQLSVTFSQPMVPVTALDALAQNKPPVTLTPQPAGTWRWLGTRTLMFQPHTRLPMATEYSVEIPAGTQAVNGQRLAQAVRWTFSTPPPGIKAVWPTQKGPETEIGDSPQGPSSAPSVPSAPVRLDPVIFAAFDQAIDPATMLTSIELRRGGSGGGARTVALRLATQAEIQADPTVANLAQNAPQGRWLAFKPAALLAADTNYEVTIRPGAKGAEGPRTTQKAQHFTFKTFGPFKAVAPSCDSDPACPPFAPVTIRFSNPIDSARFK
ncbi:MAG: Ig-like domain-containing protein, partial [Burkholderiaceae bacterium]|nr:Ig-like domain-containing protein [Burkholderiaceae bacterium]